MFRIELRNIECAYAKINNNKDIKFSLKKEQTSENLTNPEENKNFEEILKEQIEIMTMKRK